MIAVSALTSANATILMGARTTYALGPDFPMFSALGRWNRAASTPVNALLTQAAIALALVFLGGLTRKGFATMYTGIGALAGIAVRGGGSWCC